MSSKRTTFHWGTYDVETERGEVVAALPIAADPDPSPIADNLKGSLRNKLRIPTPMVRAGYLKSKEIQKIAGAESHLCQSPGSMQKN